MRELGAVLMGVVFLGLGCGSVTANGNDGGGDAGAGHVAPGEDAQQSRDVTASNDRPQPPQDAPRDQAHEVAPADAAPACVLMPGEKLVTFDRCDNGRCAYCQASTEADPTFRRQVNYCTLSGLTCAPSCADCP